ncbi:MAG: DUF4188 domain-containing protein [Propionibacteriales bacterium]|nr:DUF4188 domain-containing protein [Propionibacteriales bacterium]
MAAVHKGRFTADVGSLGDEVVVFMIGMRINKPWKIRTWRPAFVAMPRMLTYLEQHPEKGLLAYAAATNLVPVRRGRDSAAARIGATEQGEPAVPLD